MTFLPLGEAVNLLQKYRIPLDAKSGISYLSELTDKLRLLNLYQTYFPSQWNNSTAEIFSPSGENVHSPREIEFLNSVNNTLFPLLWAGAEDFECCQERLTEIPVYSHNIDWWNFDITELEPIEQFLLSLMGYGFEQSEWLEHFGFSPHFILPVDQLDFLKLESLCQKSSAPLCYLFEAVSIIDHSTDCIWLDITDECMESFEWSYESLEFLAQQWQMAKTMKSKQESLDLWLQADPRHKEETVKLWNKASKI